MRSFTFIHASEDVPRVLTAAAEAGLTIRDGEPTSVPGPVILDQAQLSQQVAGQFVAYLDEWIFDELATHLITAGSYRGKYSMSPGVNNVGIEFYFMGERDLGEFRRLGDGNVGSRIDWLSAEHHEIFPAPPEVKYFYDALCKHLDTGKRIRAGGRAYHLLEGALTKIREGYHPPFDFIEWPASLK